MGLGILEDRSMDHVPGKETPQGTALRDGVTARKHNKRCIAELTS
jgi:hypothetical protein